MVTGGGFFSRCFPEVLGADFRRKGTSTGALNNLPVGVLAKGKFPLARGRLGFLLWWETGKGVKDLREKLCGVIFFFQGVVAIEKSRKYRL